MLSLAVLYNHFSIFHANPTELTIDLYRHLFYLSNQFEAERSGRTNAHCHRTISPCFFFRQIAKDHFSHFDENRHILFFNNVQFAQLVWFYVPFFNGATFYEVYSSLFLLACKKVLNFFSRNGLICNFYTSCTGEIFVWTLRWYLSN